MELMERTDETRVSHKVMVKWLRFMYTPLILYVKLAQSKKSYHVRGIKTKPNYHVG